MEHRGMLLFLDFDGVLRPVSAAKNTLPLLPRLEVVLREHPTASVVISSTWREDFSLQELRTLFSSDLRERIIGCTPVLYFLDYLHIRHEEILTWLKNNNQQNEAWLALDDDENLFPPRCENLLLVDAEIGFDRKTEIELCERLSHAMRQASD